MPKRPLSIFCCALLFLYFPIEIIHRWHQGMPMLWVDAIISLVCPLILLVGLIRVNKFGWYTLIAMVSLWGIKDMYEYYGSQSSSLSPLIIHLFIYVFSMTYFINPRVRHLYFDPKLRWWRTKRRYETHLPFIMQKEQEWHYPILRNISEGGCFVESKQPAPIGTELFFQIPLPVPLTSISVIKAMGTVRWVSRNPARYGMGIQFAVPPAEQFQAIKEFVKRQL